MGLRSLRRQARGRFATQLACIASIAASLGCGTHAPVPNDANTFAMREATSAPTYVLSGAGECVRAGASRPLVEEPDRSPPATSCVPNAPRALPTTLTVHNGTQDLVCYVHFSQDEDSEAWGEDHLGPAETIAPAEARDFPMAPGTWRMRILDCNRTAIYQRDSFEVAESGGTLRLLVRE